MPSPKAYFDHSATTPLDPAVLEAMLPYFSERFGNPSSVHGWGQESEAAVEHAREMVAGLLGCDRAEVVFTSGGSEGDNLALRGAALGARRERGASRVLTTPVEHPAVLRTAEDLARHHGFELELLPVDGYGRVDPADLRRGLRPDTAVVSVIYANNEVGTINPIQELAAICRAQGVAIHTDAVQAAGLLPVDVQELGVDLLSIGAHKFYGPKGVGALYVRSGIPLVPVQTGGGQESGRRAGTHNVPLLVGLAEAFARARGDRVERGTACRSLRDGVIEGILNRIPRTRLTGHPKERLANHASFAIEGLDGNALLAALDLAGFACSSGSACKTGDPEPSEVLTAMGLERRWALGSLRLSFGRGNRLDEIEAFLDILPGLIERLGHAGRAGR